MIIILAGFLAAIMGITLGLLGGGGFVLALPILAYLLDVEPKAAVAMSLAAVGATSLVAGGMHARRGNVAWRVAATFAPFAMTGAYLGGRLAEWIPGTFLLIGFAVLMVVAAFSMWRGRPDGGKTHDVPTYLVAIEAFVVGIVTGLVGAGGGFLIVPVLLLLVRLPLDKAIGTSLIIIAAKSAAGFAGFVAHVQIDWALLASFTAFATVGSLVGSRLGRHIEASTLRRGFAVFIAAVAFFIVGTELDWLQLPVLAVGALVVGVAANIWGLVRLRSASA